MKTSAYKGKTVYSSDGKKLGKVTTIWDGERYRMGNVLVVSRRVANDIFVPADVAEERDGHLVVGHRWDVIKSSPPLSQDRGESADDIELLHRYYSQAG